MNYVINEEMDPPDCNKKGVNMKRLTGSSILVQGLLLVVAASYPMLSSSETAPGLELVSSTVSSSETVKCVEDCIDPKVEAEVKLTCPEIKAQILKDYIPQGGLRAGDYSLFLNQTTAEKCAQGCCQDLQCHFGLMINTSCYLLSCVNGPDPCTPILPKEKIHDSVSLIYVRNPEGKERGSNASEFTGVTCEVGLGCKPNEVCVPFPLNHRSRNGVCACSEGYTFDKISKVCVLQRNNGLHEPSTVLPEISSTSTSVVPSKGLAVSVTSKNVTLPDNEVSLVAYAVPQAPPDHPYSYKWTLISNPEDDTATQEGQTMETLHLMGLKPGVYTFQVTVSSLESNGSANATINVFAEKRLNQAPVAVISPANQTVHLPTNSAVLDASLSTDDDKIISYKWELQKGPISYTLGPAKSLNSTTLQVENLISGNYTFKLTVEDVDHVTNSTTADITVIKQTDYPPTANPGQDTVIYLPQTEVILNGNMSTDDKKIVEWEWKATGDQIKAVDMQDTHTPYLKLSHLQVGLYQFELKVTDEAGQSATGTVHVIVKEPTGNPPKADAGTDQTTVLDKHNWVILDGSNSKSESNKIVKYNWSQNRGPNNATIVIIDDGNKANVTELTKGEYEFRLEVEDESKMTANATVRVTVIQKINEAPKARAGGNHVVKLPLSLVFINGSSSSDDVKIVSWTWERQPDSLAAGTILAQSDSTPVLQITDLVPGNYVFKLTVKDEQGLSDSDSMILTVENDPRSRDLVEAILAVPVTSLSESDKNKVIQQLALLLHDTKLVLVELKAQLHTDNAVIRFYGVNEKEEIMNGSQLASQLRVRLYQDIGLLQFPIVTIDTVLCLDDCSGHGVCQDTPDGRECVCSSFWMENFVKKRLGSRERNCEWSKIYVGVVASLLLMMLFALIWSLMFICRRNFKSLKTTNQEASNGGSPSRNHSKRYHSNKKYTLLDAEEEELHAQDDEDAESEDSDSDILFESRNPKSNGLKLFPMNNGSTVRNGILKHSRRVKT